jgi:hypothetical protein
MNNQDINELIFRRKLIKLLKVFNGHSYMLVDFFINNNVISSTFKKRLIKATIKDKLNINFIDINKMIEYYDSVIVDSKYKHNPEEYWNIKLKSAVDEQRYEDAANIKHYMNNKNYVIKIS